MRPPRLLAGALVLALLTAGSPVLGDSEDTRAERDRVRAEAAAVAADLDPLLAEDAELEAAVLALTADVDAQQAKVDATRAAITATEERQAELNEEIDTTEADRVGVLDRIRDLAVSEYVGSGSGEVDSYWSVPDLNAATRQRELFDNVTDTEVDAVDTLRAIESDLESLVAEEEATKVALAELEAEREARLTDLATALEEQERLQVALDARIAEFVSEADDLAAEEDALTA
ncbi:MAG: hypothetical protein ACR2QE_17590, partial [Acidimicrobiales bacterium]